MTLHGKPVAVLVTAAVLAFALIASGQSDDWRVIVNGSPVALPRPVVRNGRDLFLPLLPVARALGFQVELAPEIHGLRARRAAGGVVEYDGHNGEIRVGPVVVGQLRNFNEFIITGPIEDLLFPMDGVIALLGVDVQQDPGSNILQIDLLNGSPNIPGRTFGLSTLDYSLGITKAGDTDGHYTMLRSEALAGGIPLNSSFLLTGQGADVGFQQGTVVAEVGHRRKLTAGDQSALSGIDALVSSVRGAGFSTPIKDFELSAYGGRTAGTVRAVVGAPGVASYDSTIAGAAVRKKSLAGDLSFAGNIFSGSERRGTTIGAAFAKITGRNQIRAQLAGGTFSGFSSRRGIQAQPGSLMSFAAIDSSGQEAQRLPVHGGAVGLSLFDTYSPVEPLTITAQVERYGKNFLTAREDSEYNAQTSQRLSIAARPLSRLNVYGSISRREYLLGNPGLLHTFNYGAIGSAPAMPWLQLGYFRVVQNESGSASGRLKLSQYSASVADILGYSGSAMFADLALLGSVARTITSTLGKDLSSYGHLRLHDQLQLRNLHRYGIEWQFDIPHGSLRLGLDRLANLQTVESNYLPQLGLALRLRGKQRLVATYSGERGTHVFSLVLNGPVFSRDDVQRNGDGKVRVIPLPSLEGRVYLDSDENNKFTSESDVAISGITVWLDGEASAITDSKGLFHFGDVKSGTHAIRADLADIPADMVFADSGDRRIAVLPYRSNVQNFAVVRTGALMGNITYLDYREDPDKPVEKPLAEARVIADREHDTYSDADGNITLGSLPPGNYQLGVDPETAPAGYVAVAEPRDIHVRAGETVRGVRIRLIVPPKPVLIKDLPAQIVSTP